MARAGRLGRDQQGEDVEEEFGAEITGGARVCDRARRLGMLRWRVADVAEGRH